MRLESRGTWIIRTVTDSSIAQPQPQSLCLLVLNILNQITVHTSMIQWSARNLNVWMRTKSSPSRGCFPVSVTHFWLWIVIWKRIKSIEEFTFLQFQCCRWNVFISRVDQFTWKFTFSKAQVKQNHHIVLMPNFVICQSHFSI